MNNVLTLWGFMDEWFRVLRSSKKKFIHMIILDDNLMRSYLSFASWRLILYALMFSIAKLLTLMVCVITPLFHNFSCISGCSSFILWCVKMLVDVLALNIFEVSKFCYYFQVHLNFQNILFSYPSCFQNFYSFAHPHGPCSPLSDQSLLKFNFMSQLNVSVKS